MYWSKDQISQTEKAMSISQFGILPIEIDFTQELHFKIEVDKTANNKDNCAISDNFLTRKLYGFDC